MMKIDVDQEHFANCASLLALAISTAGERGMLPDDIVGGLLGIIVDLAEQVGVHRDRIRAGGLMLLQAKAKSRRRYCETAGDMLGEDPGELFDYLSEWDDADQD